MVGAQGFFQRREVQDLNAYLISAVNVRDDVSFERIINVPKRGIGPGALKKIFAAKERDMSLQDACREAVRRNILPKKASGELERLLTFVESIGKEKPDTALRKVVMEMDYGEYIQSIAENEEDVVSRMENIKQMIYDASQKNSIADYLEDAALIRDDQDSADKKHGIRLSTIHAAKGLEFKVVIVVALEEGILPHGRSFDMKDEKKHDEGIEEERRLMYVAMTRASDFLYLTAALTRRGEATIESRFLEEIPEAFLSRS
jgi:DNA helicase-2/ATP-dependent DNA helicase PcrA